MWPLCSQSTIQKKLQIRPRRSILLRCSCGQGWILSPKCQLHCEEMHLHKRCLAPMKGSTPVMPLASSREVCGHQVSMWHKREGRQSIDMCKSFLNKWTWVDIFIRTVRNYGQASGTAAVREACPLDGMAFCSSCQNGFRLQNNTGTGLGMWFCRVFSKTKWWCRLQ